MTFFNVDRFKRNDVDNSRPILPPPPLRTTKGGKVEFEVDKIIDEKKDEHGMQLYHVLWFGGDTTWEPESHMKQGAEEAVKELENRLISTQIHEENEKKFFANQFHGF